MKVLKRHKGLAIVLGLTLILLVVIFAIFSRMILSTGKGEYGDRLKNIKEVSKEVKDKVISETEALDEVEKVAVRIQGKIVYTTITFTAETGKDKAKSIAKKTLEYYDEDTLKDYDFEFILTQVEQLDDEGNDKAYVVVGNKQAEKEDISWTRN